MYLVCGEALFDLFLKNDEGPGSLQLEARAAGSPFNVAKSRDVCLGSKADRSVKTSSMSASLPMPKNAVGDCSGW